MSGVSEAFFAAMEVFAACIPERPLPSGINRVEADHWRLTLNSSSDPLDAPEISEPLPGFTIYATSTEYFVFVMIDPAGGMIGGMPEDEFIAEMKRIAALAKASPSARSSDGVVKIEGV